MLCWEHETWLCAQLENRWNELAREDAKQRGLEAERERFKRREPYAGVDPVERMNKLYEELRNIPLSVRKERAGLGDKLGEGDHAIDEKIGDLREFIRLTEPNDRNAEAPPGGKKVTTMERRGLRTYPGRRPKGVRDALIREMIALIKERYGVKVSPDYVKLCWKKYRRDLALAPQT